MKGWQGQPSKEKQRENTIRREPCFWEYYVEGALGYMNKNVNIDVRLANGTMIRYHSISLGSDKAEKDVMEQAGKVGPGGVITLKDPPEMINVEVFPDVDGDDEVTRELNRRLRREWSHGRIQPGDGAGEEEGHGRVVIPVGPESQIQQKLEYVRGFGSRSSNCGPSRPSTATLKDRFPLELGFAMTVHKAQGRTIRRLILSLSEHPCSVLRLSWEALYVALSRVRRKDDIRILLKKDEGRGALAYVSNLKKDRYVGYYFGGFRTGEEGSPQRWNRHAALDAMREAQAVSRAQYETGT